ncbi:MAG: peptidoglycan-binding protein [Candidatus Omnitrophica bacterium]|nr:peptidoglycan-binding protein [Candidatus Omnitrophota bacterium]
MKIYFFVLVIASLVVVGCGKAAAPQQEAAVNSDGLSVAEADSLLAQPANEETAAAQANIVVNKDTAPLVEQVAVETTAVSDSADDISVQKALKNAGLYEGEVDGKIGPRTKEAIKEFQRKNNLVDDGKVGPKTWSVLRTYLEQPAVGSTETTGN